MRVVTIISLGASAVLGLGALVVAKTVLPAQARAEAGPPAPQVQGVPVVVAAKDLKYGDKIDATMLTVVSMPANLAPQGAFTSAPQVLAADKGGPPVALMPIAAREPILPAKLSGPGARPSVAAEVAEGFRAYTIRVSDVSGVGGHALPGDRVDVMLMRDLTPQGDTRTYSAQVVLQNVRVLGIDLNADLASDKPATPNTATLEVSVEDAQKLNVAAAMGVLSLALRRTGQADLSETAMVRGGDFLIGGQKAVLRSTGGVRRPAAYAPAVIRVVEGEKAKRERKSVGRMSAPAPASDAAPAGRGAVAASGVAG